MKDLNNTKLGLFVAVGTALLITALYLVGTTKNMFGSTFRISARFHNVNGLTTGGNVRFAGINVGTIKSIELAGDAEVTVVMLIEKKIGPFIKKNALASIGTDGLMGNKLVNINSVTGPSANVQEDDVLQSLHPIEMDEMVRTLSTTNENIKVISTNLRTITDKINSKNSLWSLLLDTIVAENLKTSIVNIRLMSSNAVMITGDLKGISDKLKNGKGALALITDTAFSQKINHTIVNLNRISDSAATITGNLGVVISNLKQGRGTVGVLLNDTSLIYNLNTSIKSINSGAGNFNENMEALKHSWPFKKYFRKIKQKK